jgi:D-alanine-D-alanine ligase
MKNKLKTGVLLGGISSEREISLVTGEAVFSNLDRQKYNVQKIEMAPDGRLFLISEKGKKRPLDLANKDKKLFDLIFIALHGEGGEDGTIQGMLEILGIPYIGSGILASATAMSKVHTGEIYKIYDLPTPEFVHFTKKEWKKEQSVILQKIQQTIGLPAVVKPVDQGSAVGVSIVKTEEELKKTITKTISKFNWLMVQKFIKGSEATCGVLEKKGKAFALPPTHILPQAGAFYDYKSKYKPGGSRHICPADFSPETNQKIQQLALKAHEILGCRGMSRTDIMVGESGDLYLLETNTIPGMTPTSLLPEAAEKAGISFSEMLDLIIEASL